MSAKMQDFHMEKCLFGTIEIDFPEVLIEEVELFTEILSRDTFQVVLSDSQRTHLKSFLPSFPSVVDDAEKEDTLRSLFSGCVFKFGNPVKQFYKKLRDGAFSPDVAKYAALCSKAKEREYWFQQRVYYSSLLREVLFNRRRIIEALHHMPPDENIKLEYFSWNPKGVVDQNHIDFGVTRKCRQLMNEVNMMSQQTAHNSSASTTSEDEANRSCHNTAQSKFSKLSDAKLGVSVVVDTFARRPTFDVFSSPRESAVRQKRLLPMPDISKTNFKTLISNHKRRKLEHPDHPELNTAELTLEDIITRVHAARKKKRFGIEGRKLKSLKDSIDLPAYNADNNQRSVETAVKQEPEEMLDVSAGISVPQQNYNVYSNFFCLIKHFICEEPQQKITTSKMEEKIEEWQCSGHSYANSWCTDINWTDLVQSAFTFLSCDSPDLSLDNFLPLIEYDEQLQQGRWIGHCDQADDELSVLCDYWLANRQLEADSANALVPPPRMWTEYKVRSATGEEKLVFQAQERERFDNPHKAFTYHMHGYDAVVGPIKGVFTKETSVRPRDHALLVKDRPAYVTILSLVHDAAARLPNGEGTRADICELLKDSQFISSAVTDAQINGVVSGALDRLHYEKDPCVKYDGARKVWIYRHRSRAEDEFERIHQAHCFAMKAKKKAAVSNKPKPPKSNNSKCKEQNETVASCEFVGGALLLGNTSAPNKMTTLSSATSSSATVSSHLLPIDSPTVCTGSLTTYKFPEFTRHSLPVTKATTTWHKTPTESSTSSPNFRLLTADQISSPALNRAVSLSFGSQSPAPRTLPVVRSVAMKPVVLVSSTDRNVQADKPVVATAAGRSVQVMVAGSNAVCDVPTSLMSTHVRSIIIGSKPQTTFAARTVQFVSRPIQLLQNIRTVKPCATRAQTTCGPPSPLVIRTRLSSSPTLVSQILHQQSLPSVHQPQHLFTGPTQVHALMPSQLRVGTAGQMRLISSLGQAHVVIPSDRAVTQLPSQSALVAAPNASNNASIQLIRGSGSLAADKSRLASSQPTTYLLAAAQPSSLDTTNIGLQFGTKSSHVVARCIINPATSLRMPAVLQSQVNAVQTSVFITTAATPLARSATIISSANKINPPCTGS